MSDPQFVRLDPSKIRIGANVRTDLHADAKEFARSLKERGVLEPVTVYVDEEGAYVVLRGQRRAVVAAEVGLTDIPAQVVPKPDEADRITDQMVENLHRAAMRDSEIVGGVEQLALVGVSAAQIAKRAALPRDRVNAAIAVADKEQTRARVVAGDLTLDEAAIFAEFSVISTRRDGGLREVGLSPDGLSTGEEAGVQVIKQREDGIVRRVVLVDDAGDDVARVNRFLSHLMDSGYSPNTVCAYGYDLRHLALFLTERSLDWNDFRPATALEFLGYLRRVPSRRPAQRLGLTVATEQGRLLSPATVQRVLAATSSFFDWAIAAEQYTSGENPMQRRIDDALGRVPDHHQPFVGAASRQQPIRRTVRVRLPLRLPRPVSREDIDALLASLTTMRDLAIFLLMLDGGLRPGEVLCLRLDDISYGRRRVTIRKRDDHPRGARAKARYERVVDLHEPRTLDAVNRYVLHERPLDAESPFVFLVGGTGARRCEPLSYQAVARGFARRLDRLGIRSPDKTPHALRHTHATAMWEGGMRELALQKRLGHASPESIRIYTRVTDEQVLADYDHALRGRS